MLDEVIEHDFWESVSCLAPNSAWSNRHEKLFADKKLTAIRLSESLGWKSEDVSFLQEISPTSVEIFTNKRVPKLEDTIAKLPQLVYLALSCPYRNLDLSHNTNLQRLAFRWFGDPGLKHLLNLHFLNILGFKGSDLECLKSLEELRSIKLSSRTLRCLKGLNVSRVIEELDLFDCRSLSDIRELHGMIVLRNLEFESCKHISHVVDVSMCKSLERLAFKNCGKIAALEGLGGLTNLKEFILSGDTEICDRDLTGLRKIEGLERTIISRREIYKF